MRVDTVTKIVSFWDDASQRHFWQEVSRRINEDGESNYDLAVLREYDAQCRSAEARSFLRRVRRDENYTTGACYR